MALEFIPSPARIGCEHLVLLSAWAKSVRSSGSMQAALVCCTLLFSHPFEDEGVRTTVSFQQGVNGYTSAVDTEIWALAANTILESNPNASSDANNDGGESQVLLRFDDIIGDLDGQVPVGSHVVSARLYVSAFDQGSTVNLHRMLVPFSRSATWNATVDGVSADDAEASRHKDSFTFGKIAANTSTVVFDVTDTVSAWAQGQPNHGWVFINTGGNGWDFYTSEFEDLKQRPKLVIEFEPPLSQEPSKISQDSDLQTPSVQKSPESNSDPIR
jgi:hypothetical protein